MCAGGAGCAPVPSGDVPLTGVFEFEYPYNSGSLSENHFIVLDTARGMLHGWYYGTSDEFDNAREGYLPGFFVAEMQDLELADGRMNFSLHTPEVLFAGPVPLRYRHASEVPAGTLETWRIPLPASRRSYVGAAAADRIVLRVDGGDRVFLRAPPDQRRSARISSALFILLRPSMFRSEAMFLSSATLRSS